MPCTPHVLLLQGSREGFLVEFDQSCALKGKVQRGWQETPLFDIVHYDDARRQPLAPGDRVLAPWEAPAKRFGPGTVLRVEENTEAPSGTCFGCFGFLSSAGLAMGRGHCREEIELQHGEFTSCCLGSLLTVFLLLALSHLFRVRINADHRICICFVLWVKTS